ncbi:MAG: GntR family transcriptional regulator [Leucobacter sp.]|jgi:GntR family transcriptional regulator|nr:GntR family transcriptional regulator [Leucobacter sp.]
MLISIDAASERPIYEQIADSVRRAMSSGVLKESEKLPPASEVAAGLAVNKHTVLRAYQDLRDEGLVDLRRGRGAVVTSAANTLVALLRDAEKLAIKAAGLGVSAETLTAMVAQAYEQKKVTT